jgi:hypothetical protein
VSVSASHPADPYREWDAAYVLGGLSPAERREYERHLAECDACSAEVAGLAGMGGLLASVPREHALALVHDAGPGTKEAEAPSMLPGLLDAARKARRWTRIRLAAVVAGVAAAAAALALFLPVVFGGTEAPVEPAGTRVALEQVMPSTVTAEAVLFEEEWGTRIDVHCTYQELASPTNPSGEPSKGYASTYEYALFVTDTDGETTMVATWMAEPGSYMVPTGTTGATIDQIQSLEVRLMPTEAVVLHAAL